MSWSSWIRAFVGSGLDAKVRSILLRSELSGCWLGKFWSAWSRVIFSGMPGISKGWLKIFERISALSLRFSRSILLDLESLLDGLV